MREILTNTALSWVLLATGANAISIDFGGDPNEAIVFLSESGPGAEALGFTEEFLIGITIRGITPDPKDGTLSGRATNVESPDIVLEFDPLDFDGAFAAAIAAPELSGLDRARGDWDVEITDGTETLAFRLAGVGDVEPPKDVFNVMISDGLTSTTPTLSFQLPPDFPEEAQVFINLYDLLDRGETTNFARSLGIFFASEDLIDDTGKVTVRVPDGFIEENGLYAFSIETTLRRPEGTFNPSGSSQEGALLVQNTSYAFFTPLEGDLLPDGINTLFLPTASTTTNGLPTFIFDNEVFAEQVEYYDPLLTEGYDFALGLDDPYFNSVVLPPIGDEIFEILLKDSNGLLVSLGEVRANEEFFFADVGASKVDFFRVLGIELDAAVDPFDPTAFVTGLSFVSDGRFTGSMTPIVVDTSTAVIPLPASAWMLLAGLGGFIAFGHRRRST